MLESYVTPLLMSYVNKYIKNLRPSDLQLSLWGGDVVLSKLDLKLDVLEQELKLPFTFMSGHIHELRIHVPWTKLGSEPVVITINTMECILKLKDGAQDDHESGSSSTSRSVSDSSKAVAKPRRLQQAAPSDPDLPPGYVQSLIRRVVNNVNIVVNNLILKYVEDDIVLSVNITSAECYTVDDIWERAFMDITAPELVLRKVINFADCTVCLDKRNASGKIEFYQDPLLYKCSFRTRLHFTYDNINSKIPSVIKIQTMVESLKLSITDQQLPMFIRILELIIALYYGEIGGHKEGEGEEGSSHVREAGAILSGMDVDMESQGTSQYSSPDLYMLPEEADEGWVSWAWSFVPAIVGTEEEGEEGLYQQRETGGIPNNPQQHTPKDPIVSIGFYCTKASVTFKLTETQSESSYYSPQKVKSREVLCLEQEGMTIEVLMMGEPFFDCQIGFVGCRAHCLKGIMGVRDFEENMHRREEDAVFFSCGDSLSSKGMTYLTNSLFDYRSPENNGVRAEFILDAANHKETYTEIAGMQRFGAFYMDYLYTMENSSGKGSQDFSVVSIEEVVPTVQETSIKRLVVGPLDIRLHSSAVHRILKMVTCAMDHEYEPYCKPQQEMAEESHGPATPEEISSLEEFIPTRLTCVTLLQVSVTVSMAEFNLLHTLMPVIMGHKTAPGLVNIPVFQPLRPLPSVQFQVERVNIEHSVPMYAPELVSTVSSLSQPSDNLLHHCYAHFYLKVFGFQAGLTCQESTGGFLPLIPIIPSFSTALYGKLIQMPTYWSKRSSVPTTECIFELPHFTVQATRAQTLLLQAICQSWTHSVVSGAPLTLSESLLNEVYKAPGVKSPGPSPTLEGSVQNLELKFCSLATVKCASGTVGAVKVCARTPGLGEGVKEKLVPLIQGPSDTKELHMSRWLNEIRKPESLLAPDLLAFSVQVPQQGDDCRNSGGVLLVSVQGIAVNVDPVFCTWLLYQPHRGSSRQQTPGSVLLAKRREDEVSVGSTPLAKQPSNQASDYASSPVKTKTVTESRPLSIPMKVMPDNTAEESWTTSEERMKELIAHAWDAVKRLTLQLELQSCCVFLPNDSLPSPSTIICGDIPGTVRSWYHNQASMPGTLVVCLPQISVLSAGHKYMEPLQELPFVVSKPILEEGDAFPWTVSLSQFSVYTLLGQQRSLSLLEPMGCTSTLAVTSHKLQSCSEGRNSFVVCLHVDLQPIHVKCSNPQVQLLYELLLSWSSTWARLQRHGILRQTSSIPEPPSGAAPSSPVRSSAGTALPDTSTCSPSADFGSPTEGDSVPAGDDSPFADTVTLEQKTSSIGGTSGKVSLWMQWMLPKVTVKLFAPDPASKKTEICVISELEDLSASVDVQDVYTKIKCKVVSFNIDHYRCSMEEGDRSSGSCGGVVLSCTDKLNRRTVLVRPVSKQDTFSHFSGFFPPTAAKVLEGSHQQHGFLSITYTQAVTKNVRHKLTTRQERQTRSSATTASQRVTSDPLADSSPQYLREILLTAQPFDVVLFCPLLATVAGVFQATVPRRYRERGKSAGQPMRSHTLTSRCLPLIYINTSVIRVFSPRAQDKHTASDFHVKKEDTLVLKLGSLSMAPQADNPLTRTVLRKDIYQRALNLGILRDPGSEVEDRQYQVDLQSINIGTAQWEQLKPEKEGIKGGVSVESERSSQNPALEWNMASSIRRHQERRAILTPILTDFSVRVTAAPAIIFSKNLSPDCGQAEEVVVCGHSLEVNVTSSLDFYLSIAQVQLLQQLFRDNMVGMDAPEKSAEVRRSEQKRGSRDPVSGVDSSSRHSGTGQDSGFGSDSARIRIVQIEQQSGASHHCIARPSHKSTITKNLSFIPFDIFVTASRLSVMTYACSSPPKALPSSSDTPSTPEKKEPGDKVGKSALNQPDILSESPPASTSPTPDPAPAAQDSLAGLTADDILNSNTSQPASPLLRGSLLSLDGLPNPSRSSARQALGVTIVRQPGRRGAGDQVLEPLLYLQVMQPSALLSCHHRKQRMELSVFDVALRGVASDYKCLDPGKTLPESLDYNVFWLQTVAGEVDNKTGIPPPLLCLQIKDFLNGPAELNVELSRPLKMNPTLAKLEQAKAYLKKVLPNHTWDTSSKPPSASSTPQSSPMKTLPRAGLSRSDTHHQASALGKASSIRALALSFHKVSLHTAQIVVVMETEAHPVRPSVTVTVSAMTGSLNMKSGPRIEDAVQAASVQLELQDVLVRTGLKDRSRLLLGPFSCSSSLEARWCRHSGSPGPEPGPPKLLLDLKGGLLQVFLGQEHLNCLKLVEEHLQVYLNLQKRDSADSCSKGKACHTQPPPSPGSPSPRTEHSSDDLRTGNFQYLQDSASQRLPGPHEVVFYSETEDSPGVMLWRYPEPRVLTFVRITPVPFNTTEDPEISTADLGDVLQVPCSLEYWDELQQAFVPYREFSLSESTACQLQLPSLSLTDQQKELVASDLWRIVLNNNGEGGDEQSSDSDCGSQLPCDQLVSPMALAACTRVDSCFAPWFVPSLGVSLQLAQLDIHLCHHLEELGTVPSEQLRPFLPDRKLPQEQEFMVIGAREPRVFLRQWNNGPRHCQEFSFSTQLDCKLLEYRNLTHLQLLQPCVLQGQAAATCCPQNTTLDVNVFVDPVFLNISQYAIHTVDTALHSWQQNGNSEAEELVYSHYVICNDTHETLRFGQVDTDENVLLASLHSHQYSWRSHKSPQLLHICIEGWGNWRWSEAFSVDNVGTLLRTIQYKGRTASLIIKVVQLNGVQKQVIICGRQVMCSYLTQDIELRVVQHYVGPDSQTVVREHCDCLEAEAKLPSYVLEDAEMTELCVRARGDEDWSQDVQLERRDKGSSSSVVQVPCSSGSLLYVWCTLITIEPDSHMQQRVVVFSPLFVMRSHLPDPVILHIEKRSLGLRESQLIHGQGHQEPLLNTEADLTHHLTFQAREDEDASHCAVPISTSLIKQIVNKAGNEDNLEHILADFYGPKTSTEPSWPYVTKDTDRSVLEPLAQWDSPMQVKLSCWKSGLNTLLVELLPWALLANHSQWDLWLFEGETIVLQIPASKVIVPPNFKEAFQIGIYWAHTNTVHKSTALKLVHDLTSPRWKEGSGSEVVTLDEEGYVEADITLGAFPGRQKLCQFCVSSVVRHGIQILQIEDRTILVNNTPYMIQYRPLLTDHALGTDDQVVFLPGFGCLYIDVEYEKGTLVLSLAPEGSMDAVINQHSRSFKLSCRVLLSEASVVLSDDITSPSSPVELLRLTLTKLLLSLAPAPTSLPPELAADPSMDTAPISALMPDASLIELCCSSLQVDNQLYNRASFHFPVLLCQDQRGGTEPGGPWSRDATPTQSPEALEEFKRSCFLQLRMLLSGDGCTVEEVTFQLQPARVYLEDTFVYYIKTLFNTYIPDSAMASASASTSAETKRSRKPRSAPILPEQVLQSMQALVHPVRLQRLTIQPVNLLVSIHASLKLYIASDHTPLSFSLFERGPLCTTARQLVHALAMHYAAGALFRAGWVVGSLEILGSPASLVRSIGNGVSDFFRLPYEGLTRGPGAFVSGVSRGTTSFVKHISKGTLTSITNLATSLARNMDRLSLDEEHYTRQEEWRRQLPESLGDGLRQGLSRLGISLLGAIAGIVDQPMQNFQRNWEMQSSAGSKAKGVISGVGKGIVGVFTKPIGGAAELVSQTGYGILHGAGLWQLPKQLYLPTEEKSAQAPNSHLKYVWKMLQSLGRPELHMALEVTIVSGSGQEHAGCLLLTSEVLFVVSLSEDTQQQAFPITEVECQQEPGQQGELTLTLQQQTVTSDTEGDSIREHLSEQQYRRLVDYVTRASQFLSPSAASLQLQPPVTLAEPPPSVTKSYRYLVDPAFAKVFVSKFTMVKNKALRIGFH
ncbi:intermembrane lipid transfer protein VPS13B-like isoform X3 [Pagrus major]|uniref:intermembrane lipid transfer protein VPS13B-like isoform X3 n=1 Tax=Pagrus major TaxID=143350 RepID=UPI003CC8D094